MLFIDIHIYVIDVYAKTRQRASSCSLYQWL